MSDSLIYTCPHCKELSNTIDEQSQITCWIRTIRFKVLMDVEEKLKNIYPLFCDYIKANTEIAISLRGKHVDIFLENGESYLLMGSVYGWNKLLFESLLLSHESFCCKINDCTIEEKFNPSKHDMQFIWEKLRFKIIRHRTDLDSKHFRIISEEIVIKVNYKGKTINNRRITFIFKNYEVLMDGEWISIKSYIEDKNNTTEH